MSVIENPDEIMYGEWYLFRHLGIDTYFKVNRNGPEKGSKDKATTLIKGALVHEHSPDTEEERTSKSDIELNKYDFSEGLVERVIDETKIKELERAVSSLL